MRNIALIIICAILTACSTTRQENVITVAGFDIEKGQHMHDFLMIMKNQCAPNTSVTILANGPI
jgi:hypothetical protein